MGATVDKIFEILLLLGKFYYFEVGEDEFYDLDRLHSFLIQAYGGLYDVDAIMTNLTIPCERMIKRCMWRGTIVSCPMIFEQRKTYMGKCCIFNYQRPTTETFQ